MRIPRLTVAATTAAILALGVAACGSASSGGSSSTSGSGASRSSGSGSSTSTSSGPGTTTSSGSSDVAAAQKLVASAAPLATSFQVPGPPIKGGGKSVASGKTVWYVPVTALPPWFQIQSKVQQSVWSILGATVHVCDGQGNPTTISTCLTQAVARKAALVITDAIPVAFVQDAYNAVVNAHIPVVAGYTDKSATPTNGNFGKYFQGVSGEEALTQEIGAAEVIVASGGKANVLVAGANDTPSAAAASEAAISYFKTSCPGCTVSSFMTKTVGNQNLASVVSGQLLRASSPSYLYTPYEAPSGPLFLQGVRQTGRTITFMSTAGDVAGLARIRGGEQLADVGLDPVYQGWNYVDAGLRALAGMAHVQYHGIVHLFTKDNVPKNPTDAGWLSGKWYSSLSFESVFKKTWGVA
jgi:ribose transport system substrate-binding protein